MLLDDRNAQRLMPPDDAGLDDPIALDDDLADRATITACREAPGAQAEGGER